MNKERAPYGRQGAAEAWPAYNGENYYRLPAVNPSVYSWPIIIYFFLGGMVSAAQFIATIDDLFGGGKDRTTVRNGRYLALLGAIISPLLLIGDLFTPQRWYNMVRIYRSTSPMSIGTWALLTFGGFSGLAAVAQVLEDFGVKVGRPLGRAAELPAALAGGIVSLYTGTLLAATNMPLAASSFPFLSSLFASSAASTGVAALSLMAEAEAAPLASRRRLNRFALVTSLAEMLLALRVKRQWQRQGTEAAALDRSGRVVFNLGVLGIGVGVPLAAHGYQALTRRDEGALSVLAALSSLIGGLLLRAVLILGSNRSTQRPEPYLRMSARPRAKELDREREVAA